jgi:hypothetical protein
MLMVADPIVQYPCAWHRGEEAIRLDEAPSCPDCGRLFDTQICDGCGLEFLYWEGKTWDAMAAPPTVTPTGDVLCLRCMQQEED